MTKIATACALALMSSQSFAAGFLLNETSASGLGRAFAGEGAAADDAAVLARNPAAMALFDTAALSIAGTYIDPGVDMNGVTNPFGDPNNLDIDGAAPEAFIPAAYYIRPLNDKVAVGFAAFTNFGLGTDFDDDHGAGPIAGKTDMITMNFNASVSYRINDNWSVGAGANVVYGDAEFERFLGDTADFINSQLPVPFGLENTDVAASMKGDGFGYGYNIGVMYEVNDRHRFALTYRSDITLELEGDYYSDLPSGAGLNGTSGEKIDGYLDLELPAIAEFSGYHEITDQVTLHTTVMWTNWSVFEDIDGRADGDSTLTGGLCGLNPVGCEVSDGDSLLLKEENFEDAWRFGLGMTYKVSSEVALRAGIAYDETPVPENHRSISIPDSDRIWYSIGANYRMSDQSSIDFAFSFIDGEEVEVNESGFVLESEGNAILVAAQYNYAF
ncbi:outer membrane protein transport protein [Ferrimonas lipolytica]|uniref:Long-chain fatty acid transporter n=1 Tax=Ferrimonas lipolytica TaxID=2724191 RepID=A0A6H1UDQ1_9GAMM|nr:outer membrane protein transport protein [Ferrimonas lipolytica]QIZ77237.1 long-chain fatty acid transporter [Ferrimonas lipolytica]